MKLNAFGDSLVVSKIKSKLPSVMTPFLNWVAFLPLPPCLPSFFSPPPFLPPCLPPSLAPFLPSSLLSVSVSSSLFKICFLPLENPRNHNGS